MLDRRFGESFEVECLLMSRVPLVGSLKGLWRVRVGKYRVIYEIDEKEKIVVFHDVDLRKRVY